MEVRIGVQETARELTLESTQSAEEIVELVTAAVEAGGLVNLVDEKGHRVVVPAAKLAYVEIAAPEARKVGFATI